MSRSKIDLDRITVASPCPMAWEDMAGDDRARFCNQCNLNVYNISAMTKPEAESFIANTEGRICVNFYRRADGTILTQDCPVGLRAVRKKVSRAAAATFSALLSLFGGSALYAQQQPKSEHKVDIKRTLRQGGPGIIEGTIFDVNRAVIAGAQIKLINERTKRESKTKTGEDGTFWITDVEPGSYTIQAEMRGFRKLTFSDINIADEEALNLDVTLEVGSLGGVAVVPSSISIDDTNPSGELKRKDRSREYFEHQREA
jgi:hypothetical protein